MITDTMLVGTDFSDVSILAAEHAAEFASRLAYNLHLVHIIDPDHSGPVQEFAAPQIQLEKVAKKIREKFEIEVETEIYEGTPGRALAGISRDKKYAMVAVGYSGNSGFLSRIGSVASQIVRLVDKPILVMVSDHHTVGPVIGCIDFSDQTDKINYWTHAMAELHDQDPAFTHVAVPFDILISGTPHTGGMGLSEAVLSRFGGSEEGYRQRLEVSVRHRLGLGMEGEATVLLSTSPSKAISEFAEKKKASLIVVGRHGHNTIAARIIGSTAEHIIGRTHCSVLVLP